MGELRPPQHPGFENQNQEGGGLQTYFLFWILSPSTLSQPTVAVEGVCFGQPRGADGYGKRVKKMEHSRQESGKVWAFPREVEAVRRASAPVKLGHTYSEALSPLSGGVVAVSLHGCTRLNHWS